MGNETAICVTPQHRLQLVRTELLFDNCINFETLIMVLKSVQCYITGVNNNHGIMLAQ